MGARKAAGQNKRATKSRDGMRTKGTAKPGKAAKARGSSTAKGKARHPLEKVPDPIPTVPSPVVLPVGVERREHMRVPYGAWVTVTGQNMRSFCLAQDLSEGGIYLKAAHPPPLGEKVSLTIVIENDSTPLELEGQVVRRSQGSGGFAVRFLQVAGAQARRLHALVAELAASRSGVAPTA